MKKCCALFNQEQGSLDENVCNSIVEVCDEIIKEGMHKEQFPLCVFQTGSGTQSNMNVNEVVANVANIKLGEKLPTKTPVHPNDHVNRGQSSNDSFPTAMYIACAIECTRTITKLRVLEADLAEKVQSEDFRKTVKIGRTHTQDATPLTLSQEFSGYHQQVVYGIDRLQQAMQSVLRLALGGTAVGTGLNTEEGYDKAIAAKIAEEVKKLNLGEGLNFITAPNKFESLAAHDSLVEYGYTLHILLTTLV